MATKKKKYKFTENVNSLFSDPNPDLYEERMDEIKNYITEDIERRHELCLITFLDEEARELNLGQYLTYLIILQPFFVYEEPIILKVLPDVSNINEIEKYFDWCIDYFGIKLNYLDEIGDIIVDIIDRLNEITCDMTKKFAPTFDLFTFIKLAEKDDNFAQLLYEPEKYSKEHNNELTAEEIVDYTHKVVDMIKESIVSDDNHFKNFITSGAGINLKQLGQVFGYIGLKPDLKEKIIPKPIETNFCMGLRDISDFYINAVGCLKALITVKIQTKSSGYLTRKLQILLNDEFIADVDDCGTKHLLPFTIKNKKHLLHLNNMYYSLTPDGKDLKKIKYTRDKDILVDVDNPKTIYLRNPITCACKHGICKKCYGDMWKFNHKMNIGIIAALIITNMITQTNLSVKHLLQAVVLVSLCPELLKYFTIEIDKLTIKDEYIDKISLAFDTDIADDEEEDANEGYKVSTITVLDGDEIVNIENNILFNINPEINDLVTSDLNKDLDKFVVKGKKLKNFDYIFSYSVENNSLSGPMLKLKDLIEKNEFIKNHNAFELFYKVVETLYESDSKTDYVHLGVMIKNLMKVEGGREKFKEKEFPEVKLYSVPDAIHYCSESISKPLVFERIKDQLLLDKYGTLDKKGFSNYDILLL